MEGDGDETLKLLERKPRVIVRQDDNDEFVQVSNIRGDSVSMGVRRGGQGGLLLPLAGQGRPKIVFFLDFSLFFRQKVGSCFPPGKFLPSSGKKYADAHECFSL